MSATLSSCPVCPVGKHENKRTNKKERRMYHKLLRRMGKQLTITELDFQATDKLLDK